MDPVEVDESEVKTYSVRCANGTDAMIFASENKKELDEYEHKAGHKVLILKSSMDAEKTEAAVTSAISALEVHSTKYNEVKKHIRNEFNEKYGKSWQCIIFDGTGVRSIVRAKGSSIVLKINKIEINLF